MIFLHVYIIYYIHIAILLMRPTLCRSKKCCQVLAIKDKVMNELVHSRDIYYI